MFQLKIALQTQEKSKDVGMASKWYLAQVAVSPGTHFVFKKSKMPLKSLVSLGFFTVSTLP